MLRPHVVAKLSSLPYQLEPVGDGFAALTGEGLVLLDKELAEVATIGGDSSSRFVALADGRFVTFSDRSGFFYVGTRGGAFARFCDELVDTVHATAGGYIAVGRERAWVDVDGVGRWIDLPYGGKGSVAWGEWIVVAGEAGLAVLDATGAVVTARAHPVRATPIVIGAALLVPVAGGFCLVDAALDEVTRRETDLERGIPLGERVLLFGDNCIEAWNATDAEPAWDWELPGDIDEPRVVGEWIVISSPGAKSVWILDAATGDEVASFKREVRSAAPFAGGLALVIENSDEVVWWRPEAREVLVHDAPPWRAFAAPKGVITCDGPQLLWWRTDVQGPELPPIATTIPFDVPLVIDGSQRRVVSAGRAKLRAVSPTGYKTAIAPDAAWRLPTTREEAQQILAQLLARTFDTLLPPIQQLPHYESSAAIAQLPLADVVSWHGRAMFAPATLDEERRSLSSFSRASFFAELAAALDTSAQALIAAVKNRKFPLVPPREIKNYDYLGSFTTDGKVIVSDVCYVTSKHTRPPLQLALHLDVRHGDWHAYARSGTGDAADRTSELVAIHEVGFATAANDQLAVLGNDAGQMGIYDHSLGEPPAYAEDGIVSGLGVKTSSGYGDGFYPVYGGKHQGQIVKLRVDFLEEGELDRTLPPPATTRPYSVKTTFAVGDAIEHPKFGLGRVVAIVDTKIDVSFPDGRRLLLVHGKT